MHVRVERSNGFLVGGKMEGEEKGEWCDGRRGIERAVRRAVAGRGRRTSRDAEKRAGRKSFLALDPVA